MKQGGAALWLESIESPELEVAMFRGVEALSRPYRFDVHVLYESELFAASSSLLGAKTLLSWSFVGGERAISGIVTAILRKSSSTRHKRHAVLRIEPKLALLDKRFGSRIYQDATLIDVVTRLLDAHGIKSTWKLSRTQPRRAYVVQYEESDWAFVRRLCAESGIFFYFEQPTAIDGQSGIPSERIVFCDSARDYPPLLNWGGAAIAGQIPALAFRATTGALGDDECIHEFALRHAVRTERLEVRDFDYQRPQLELRAAAENKVATNTLATLETYEHRAEYVETDVAPVHAELLLEGFRRRAIVAKGKSNCRGLSAGYQFRMEGHPEPQIDGQAYVVVRVVHAFERPETVGTEAYSNRFECVPAEVVYRPKRERKNLTQVLESAIVVGPAGDAVHTDSLGRVKVRFHWDRDGRINEETSCWIRVSQPWVGASWGAQFIPRIGTEVLVSFLGGDEDRPVIVGSVYNATLPPPFPLPLEKARSGFRTNSIGASGSNELSFDDTGGAELVYIRAQRDLREEVRKNHDLIVEGEQVVQIAGSQTVDVQGESHQRVHGRATESVTGDRQVSVGRDLSVRVGGGKTEIIDDVQRTEAQGISIHDKGNLDEIVLGHSMLVVGTEDRPTGRSVVVYGAEAHDATKGLTLRSDTRVFLQCGTSSITLEPECVRIDAQKIIVKGQERIVLLGDGPGIELGKEADILADTIKLFSKGGSVELDSSAAHVDGPVVKLNCGAGEKPNIEVDPERSSNKLFRWRFVDSDHRPYKGKTLHFVTQGFKCRGKTDGDGIFDTPVPEDAFLAEITLWTGVFPEGERLHYTIRFGDLPPAASVYGAQVRLKNLGYFRGADDGEITPPFTDAVRRFQLEHGLPTSGDVDSKTADKIEEIHG